MRRLTTALVPMLLAAGFAAAPLPAQVTADAKVLIVYGNDACPTSNGEEIVVCRRLPEQERFRIPKDLRENVFSGENQSWAVRADQDRNVGSTAIGSCTTVGPGGQSGCMLEAARQARLARKQRKANAPVLP